MNHLKVRLKRLEKRRLICTLLVICFVFGQTAIFVALDESIFVKVYPRKNLSQRFDKQNVEGFIIPRLFGFDDLQKDLEENSSISSNMFPSIAQSIQEGGEGQVSPVIFIYSVSGISLYDRTYFDTETKQLLEGLGFTVIVEDRITIPTLNVSSFMNVSQFWLMNGYDSSLFTDDEQALILDAWRNRTDIVLAGDQTNFYVNVNLIGKKFGVEYEGAYGFSDPQTPNFADHPIWINVSTIYSDPTLPKLIIYSNSNAQALSTDSAR